MSDSGMKGRVKGLLAGASPEHHDGPPPVIPGTLADALSDPQAQRQALQVLTLAQRTADEHVASAHRQAEKIIAEARAQSERIVHDAGTHAEELRRDAERTLGEARGTAEQIAREAQKHADDTRQDADAVLNEAQSRADEIVKDAQSRADELQHQAQQRYQDVVGSLATKREALQRQIEALEHFDHEYRSRLSGFLQNQLRALWVDEPHLDTAELDEVEKDSVSIPTQR